MQIDCVVDCKGMRCPSPILQVSKAIRTQLEPGQTLQVECTDPAFDPDIRAFCRQTGNELVSIESTDGYQVALIRKAGTN